MSNDFALIRKFQTKTYKKRTIGLWTTQLTISDGIFGRCSFLWLLFYFCVSNRPLAAQIVKNSNDVNKERKNWSFEYSFLSFFHGSICHETFNKKERRERYKKLWDFVVILVLVSTFKVQQIDGKKIVRQTLGKGDDYKGESFNLHIRRTFNREKKFFNPFTYSNCNL